MVIDNEPNSNFELTDEIELSGAAVDLQDGIVADAGLVWSSNISGKLGIGGDLVLKLPAGVHTITLTATDSAGLSSSGSVVVRPPGTATRLFYSTSPIATFVADVPGTYILMLTVSNGAASNSTSVTVTVTQ